MYLFINVFNREHFACRKMQLLREIVETLDGSICVNVSRITRNI